MMLVNTIGILTNTLFLTMKRMLRFWGRVGGWVEANGWVGKSVGVVGWGWWILCGLTGWVYRWAEWVVWWESVDGSMGRMGYWIGDSSWVSVLVGVKVGGWAVMGEDGCMGGFVRMGKNIWVEESGWGEWLGRTCELISECKFVWMLYISMLQLIKLKLSHAIQHFCEYGAIKMLYLFLYLCHLCMFQCGRNKAVLQQTYYLEERAVSLDNGNADYVTELGFELLLQGRTRDAIKCYRNAMKLDETSVAALTGQCHNNECCCGHYPI